MFLFVFVSNEIFLTRQHSILPDCVCFSLLCASLTCSQHPSIATHLPQNLIAHSITASQHDQLTLSASPFNIMARCMTGIYKQQRQTRHFILQKPSSCEKSQEPCNSHAGQHHTNNKLVFWLAFAGLVFEHVICNNCGCPAKNHSLFTEKCSEILSSNQAFQHFQVLVSASPFNIKVNDWDLQAATLPTRHFILQKPSSCEKNREPCNSHAGQHHTNNKLVFLFSFCWPCLWTCYLQQLWLSCQDPFIIHGKMLWNLVK